MPDTKVSALTALGTPIALTAVLPVVDSAGVSQKKATLAQVRGSSATSVKDYGAVGDGSANDTTAIHAARDAAGAGGQVVFPPGTYKVTTLNCNVAGQTWLIEAGATIIQANTTNAEMFNVSVAGMTFIGQGAVDANGANNTSNIRVFYLTADRTTIQGLELSNFYGYGIQNFGDDCDVLDCYVHSAHGTGVFYQGEVHRGHISRNLVVITDQSQADCIAAFGDNTPSRIIGLTISDNVLIRDSSVDDTPLGIEIKGGTGNNHHVIVTGNYIDFPNKGGLGISIADTNDAVVANNICINNTVEVGGDRGSYVGNIFDGSASAATGGAAFAITKSNVTGNVFVGNTMLGFRTGINFQASAIDTTIVGNTFDSQGGSGVGQGISIDFGASGTLIDGNTFIGSAGYACILIGSTAAAPGSISIANNHFNSSLPYVRSYVNSTWSSSLSVRGNTFDGGGTPRTHGGSNTPATESWTDNLPVTADDRHRGSGAVATGGTIAHGLRGTPTAWGVQPVAATPTGIYATADATNLTVTFTGGGTQTFKWWAEI